MDYTAIGAWSGLVAAVAAVIGLWTESRRSRFAFGVDLLVRLDDKFHEPAMRATRRAAAAALLSEKHVDEAAPIINFFEMVALLLEKGALDKSMVWSTFAWWILGYGIATEEYVTKQRRTDHMVWAGFPALRQQMLAIEKQHRSSRVDELIRGELAAFLRDEAGDK